MFSACRSAVTVTVSTPELSAVCANAPVDDSNAAAQAAAFSPEYDIAPLPYMTPA
jgi:hypothetical protein